MKDSLVLVMLVQIIVKICFKRVSFEAFDDFMISEFGTQIKSLFSTCICSAAQLKADAQPRPGSVSAFSIVEFSSKEHTINKV